MTGRTHDLAAFTAINLIFVTQPIPQMTLATFAVSIGANMIGGLLPDIDNATADIWDKIRGGSFVGKLIKPLIGGHRMLSHSLLGMGIVGFLLDRALIAVSDIFLIYMNIVFWATMIGYFSHLLTDSLTTQGVPWLFPIPIRFGFPPFKSLRIKTGGFMEKVIVFPGLILLNGYIIYKNYFLYEALFRNFVD